MNEPKYVTDYGVLMELFINSMIAVDKELEHKSFMRKITNKLNRFHKRRIPMCMVSERRAKLAITAVNKATAKEAQLSLGAVCWLIQNKHKETLKPYGFDKKPFEEMNKYFNAQGLNMQTAKILTQLEEAMYAED